MTNPEYSISPSSHSSESVYHLLEHHTPPQKKQKRYKSRHNPNAPPTASTFGLQNTSVPGIANIGGETDADIRNDARAGHPVKRSTGLMGRSVRESVSPQKFLPKGNGLGGTTHRLDDLLQNTQKPFSGRTLTRKRDPVPKRTEKPIMGLKTDKNFITTNAVEAILSVPKKVPPKQINYVEKPEFGQVPQYLQQIKQEVQDEYEYIRQMQSLQQPSQTRTRGAQELELLPEEERLKVLEALKTKWRELNQKYQTLSFSVPTAKGNQPMLDKTKVVKKENLEKQLDQLEKDIEKFSKPNVFVQASGYDY